MLGAYFFLLLYWLELISFNNTWIDQHRIAFSSSVFVRFIWFGWNLLEFDRERENRNAKLFIYVHRWQSFLFCHFIWPNSGIDIGNFSKFSAMNSNGLYCTMYFMYVLNKTWKWIYCSISTFFFFFFSWCGLKCAKACCSK